MATMNMQKSPASASFTPHPYGSFEGYIEEVREIAPTQYPNDSGGVTHYLRRQFVIRNADDKATYQFERDGQTQTGNCTIRTRPLNIRSSDDGTLIYAPTSKAQVHQYYTAVLGETPDWTDFDDECVLGTRVIYNVGPSEEKDENGNPYSNLISPPARHPSQDGREKNEVVTQQQRQATEDAQYQSAGLADAPASNSASSSDIQYYTDAANSFITALELKGAVDSAKATNYIAFIDTAQKNGDVDGLKDFCDTMDTLRQQHKITINPHPLSRGNDDIPF